MCANTLLPGLAAAAASVGPTLNTKLNCRSSASSKYVGGRSEKVSSRLSDASVCGGTAKGTVTLDSSVSSD